MPLLDLFISVFNCKTLEDGVLHHLVYTDIICFEGTHIIDVMISCVSGVLLIIFTTIMILLCYETRYDSNDVNNKSNSYGEVIFLYFKIIMIFLFNFANY